MKKYLKLNNDPVNIEMKMKFQLIEICVTYTCQGPKSNLFVTAPRNLKIFLCSSQNSGWDVSQTQVGTWTGPYAGKDFEIRTMCWGN